MSRSRRHAAAALICPFMGTAIACATPADVVRGLAAGDLSCPVDSITVAPRWGAEHVNRGLAVYRADGCGHSAYYLYDHETGGAKLNSAVEQEQSR
jgi:hypothetical protein